MTTEEIRYEAQMEMLEEIEVILKDQDLGYPEAHNILTTWAMRKRRALEGDGDSGPGCRDDRGVDRYGPPVPVRTGPTSGPPSGSPVRMAREHEAEEMHLAENFGKMAKLADEEYRAAFIALCDTVRHAPADQLAGWEACFATLLHMDEQPAGIAIQIVRGYFIPTNVR